MRDSLCAKGLHGELADFPDRPGSPLLESDAVEAFVEVNGV